MANQITITAKKHGNLQVTAQVVPARDIHFDLNQQMVRVTKPDMTIENYDVSGAGTVTCTVSGGTFAFVLS